MRLRSTAAAIVAALALGPAPAAQAAPPSILDLRVTIGEGSTTATWRASEASEFKCTLSANSVSVVLVVRRGDCVPPQDLGQLATGHYSLCVTPWTLGGADGDDPHGVKGYRACSSFVA
jgi:hypothetical protein